MVLTFEGAIPPANNPLVEDAQAVNDLVCEIKSPKSTASPSVDIVI